MIRHYSVFAKWRKKDVEFLNTLNLNRKPEEGYFGFSVKEGVIYDKITSHFLKKDSFLSKTKPPEYSNNFTGVTFSKVELSEAKYYALLSLGGETPDSRYPQPWKNEEYHTQVFQSNRFKLEKIHAMVNKKQIAPFQIKKPKWKKKEVCFDLGLEYEYTLFKKEFYQEVLAPLGLKAIEVLDYKTGNPLEDTVQLVIPLAKSKLLLENSAYDIHPLKETGGYKQYAVQTLDFFPPFEKEFDFHICYSQEEFFIGHKKIIISKEFCDLLVKHKILKFNTWSLTPLKSKKHEN